jgi:molybdopterin biosynthesis enzyme
MTQTIARLTPLSDVQALIAAEVPPVAASQVAVEDAVGCVLAADVIAERRPAYAVAILDGWALRSDETLGASGYAPAPLSHIPQRIDAGEAMPKNCDCVAPFDTVRVAGGQAEALTEVAPGEGAVPAGGDHAGAAPIAKAGVRLTSAHAAAINALGVSNVRVRRPRLTLAYMRADAITQAAVQFIMRDAQARGASVQTTDGIEAALGSDADAMLVIGGTGTGRNDVSAETLARIGRVAVHGIALAPGETADFGFAGQRPVLLIPGRLDAALSVWLTLGRALIDRLCGSDAPTDTPETLTLGRKVTSTVGMTELVPVRRDGAQTVPLASRYWPLSAIARADGHIVILPGSEGSSAGSAVQVWRWP